MGTLEIYSKGTKELLVELEISDEILEWLKKQKDPSQILENIMRAELKKLG